jgi:hypothetical protein
LEIGGVELRVSICYIIHLRQTDAGDWMSTQETALSAARAAPPDDRRSLPMLHAGARPTRRIAAGPLAWGAGRRLLLAATTCAALWAAVLWALA